MNAHRVTSYLRMENAKVSQSFEYSACDIWGLCNITTQCAVDKYIHIYFYKINKDLLKSVPIDLQ